MLLQHNKKFVLMIKQSSYGLLIKRKEKMLLWHLVDLSICFQLKYME